MTKTKLRLLTCVWVVMGFLLVAGQTLADWHLEKGIAWAASSKFKNSRFLIVAVPGDSRCAVLLANRIETPDAKSTESYSTDVPVTVRIDDGLPYQLTKAWLSQEDGAQTVSWAVEPRMFADMTRGRTMRMQKGNGDIDRVNLAGFTSALQEVLGACGVTDEDADYFR